MIPVRVILSLRFGILLRCRTSVSWFFGALVVRLPKDVEDFVGFLGVAGPLVQFVPLAFVFSEICGGLRDSPR